MPHDLSVSVDASRLPAALVRWFSELTAQGMFATDRELRVIVVEPLDGSPLGAGRPEASSAGRCSSCTPISCARGVDQYVSRCAGRPDQRDVHRPAPVRAAAAADTIAISGSTRCRRADASGRCSDGDDGDRHRHDARRHLRPAGQRGRAAKADRGAADWPASRPRRRCAPRTSSCRPCPTRCATRSTRCWGGRAS